MRKALCTFLIATTLVSVGMGITTNAAKSNISDAAKYGENVEAKAWQEQINYFVFEAKNNERLDSDIRGYIVKDNVYCFMPPDIDVSNLIATFGANTNNIKVNNITQQSGVTSNDYSKAVTYTLNDKTNYKVTILKSDLPTIEINTENNQNITSKDTYINANMAITGTEDEYEGSIQIRGRGNSTWGMPKKPYRIKLNKKADLLGMGVEKDWVLLANYADKTLMRNKLALDLAAELGDEFTTASRMVDVILNGEYVGSYLLCEQVEVSETRVNIDELEETDTSEESITGGYLLEVDFRLDEDNWFKTGLGVPITFKSPKAPNKEQFNYITGYVDGLEKTLVSSDFTSNGKHYSDYIDVDSFVDYYLINELFKNWDAAFRTSVNMYKPRDGKITMGPVWDFDIGAGNANIKDFQVHLDNTSPEGWWMRYEGWYGNLFKDPEFIQKVQDRFWELIDVFEGIGDRIDNYEKELKVSQNMNFIRWDILGQWVWPNVVVTGSYEKEVQYLKTWMTNRVEWMKNNMGTPTEKPDEKNDFDINKDGKINVGDVAIISKNYGVYNEAMDLNKDGNVDKEDIAILIDEILK